MTKHSMSDLAPLIGAWRLISFGVTTVATKERTQPFGPAPQGRMVLEPGGHIMFLFMGSNRSPPESETDRAILFEQMFAYSGHVHLDTPGCFITAVDLAWNPSWQGEQKRFFRLEGNRLEITTPELIAPVNDSLIVGDLVWERE